MCIASQKPDQWFGQKCDPVKVTLSVSSWKNIINFVCLYELAMWISAHAQLLFCLILFFLSCSPSLDTWLCSSVPSTLTYTAGTDSSVRPPTNGTLLQPTCSLWWCPLQWSCSGCWSSCPVWTAASPAFEEAGRGWIQRRARSHC